MEPTLIECDVEKYDGKRDFALWKYRMVSRLEILGLESTLQEVQTGSSTVDPAGETVPVSEDPKRSEKEKRAKYLISLSLSDPMLRKVMNEPTALDMWKALERDYQTKLPNRICMKVKFCSFKMDDNKSIDENLDVFFKLVSDLASLNINISDEDQAFRILNSLPKQYESLIDTALKYGSGKGTLTVRDVTSFAYSKEMELKEKGLLNKPGYNPEGNGKGSSKSKNRSESRSRNNNNSHNNKNNNNYN